MLKPTKRMRLPIVLGGLVLALGGLSVAPALAHERDGGCYRNECQRSWNNGGDNRERGWQDRQYRDRGWRDREYRYRRTDDDDRRYDDRRRRDERRDHDRDRRSGYYRSDYRSGAGFYVSIGGRD